MKVNKKLHIFKLGVFALFQANPYQISKNHNTIEILLTHHLVVTYTTIAFIPFIDILDHYKFLGLIYQFYNQDIDLILVIYIILKLLLGCTIFNTYSHFIIMGNFH